MLLIDPGLNHVEAVLQRRLQSTVKQYRHARRFNVSKCAHHVPTGGSDSEERLQTAARLRRLAIYSGAPEAL